MFISPVSPPPPATGGVSSTTVERSVPLTGTVDVTASVPTIALDVARISHAMAARLSVCLLGHVLYLNSQIPFPLAQLVNLLSTESEQLFLDASSTSTPDRTLQKRKQFLTTFDTFSSHLRTTFTALSTALARNQRDFPSPTSPQERRNPAKIHLAVALGPAVSSLSAAKARTIFEIDGFDVALWGERADKRPATVEHKDEESSEDEEGEEEESGESQDEDHDDASNDSASVPPDSESESDPSDCGYQDESDPSEDDDEEDTSLPDATDSEEALRIAERLMSRALAMANADVGLGSDIPPTQASILLRAPRRFDHPAWIPRQQISRDMDKLVTQVFVPSAEQSTSNGAKPSKGGRVWGGVKTEGMRVRCTTLNEDVSEKNLQIEEDEDDEMIWWSWDGKLVGLGDW